MNTFREVVPWIEKDMSFKSVRIEDIGKIINSMKNLEVDAIARLPMH